MANRDDGVFTSFERRENQQIHKKRRNPWNNFETAIQDIARLRCFSFHLVPRRGTVGCLYTHGKGKQREIKNKIPDGRAT